MKGFWNIFLSSLYNLGHRNNISINLLHLWYRQRAFLYCYLCISIIFALQWGDSLYQHEFRLFLLLFEDIVQDRGSR